MKIIFILLLACLCFSSCASTKKNRENQKNIQNNITDNKKNVTDSKKNDNKPGQQVNEEDNSLKAQEKNNTFDSDFAIEKVRAYLKITDSTGFSFTTMSQDTDTISIKVISDDLKSEGGSGTVGIYLVYKSGEVKEDVIPSFLKGTWRSADGTITYIIKDDTFQDKNADYKYTIIDVKMTDENDDCTTYELDWDLDKFKSEYKTGSMNPQPIFLRYCEKDDTIDAGGKLYRQ